MKTNKQNFSRHAVAFLITYFAICFTSGNFNKLQAQAITQYPYMFFACEIPWDPYESCSYTFSGWKIYNSQKPRAATGIIGGCMNEILGILSIPIGENYECVNFDPDHPKLGMVDSPMFDLSGLEEPHLKFELKKSNSPIIVYTSSDGQIYNYKYIGVGEGFHNIALSKDIRYIKFENSVYMDGVYLRSVYVYDKATQNNQISTFPHTENFLTREISMGWKLQRTSYDGGSLVLLPSGSSLPIGYAITPPLDLSSLNKPCMSFKGDAYMTSLVIYTSTNGIDFQELGRWGNYSNYGYYDHSVNLDKNVKYVKFEAGCTNCNCDCYTTGLNSIQFFDNTNVKLEETNVDRINVSPNPATNKVTVSSNDLIIENLSLFNQQGQLLKEAYHTSEMDISNFSPGIYFLQIKIQDGVVTKKIIKI